MALSSRAARTVKIHCPIAPETLGALLTGNLSAIETDAVAARMLAIIRAENPLGDFDLYRGVFEISLGFEGFTTTDRANPTLGGSNADTLSPTAVITTYIDAGADPHAVTAALNALVQAHPWETPVIAISEHPVQLIGVTTR